MRLFHRLFPPVYPPLPPDTTRRPPEHEPHYHELAARSANASARVWLAERDLLRRLDYIDTATEVLRPKGGGDDPPA